MSEIDIDLGEEYGFHASINDREDVVRISMRKGAELPPKNLLGIQSALTAEHARELANFLYQAADKMDRPRPSQEPSMFPAIGAVFILAGWVAAVMMGVR